MGYFRFLYYISYIFNTIIRIFRKNKKFIFILIVITLIFIVLNNESQAIYIGDYTYGDPNYAVNNFYENINIDFLRRLDNYNGTNKTEFLNRFKNNRYSVYLYYGTFNGSDNVQGQTYNTNNLRIMIYRNNFVSSSVISPSSYDNFCGIQPVDIKLCTFYDYYFYYFDGLGNLSLYSDGNSGTQQVYIPSTLINYLDDCTFNYIYNNYSIEQVEALKEINDNLDTITDDTVSQDTTDSTNDVLEDSQSVFDNSFTNDLTSYNNSFLQTILAPINQLADGTTTKRVSFTLPYVNYTYTLRGDAISSHIRDTSIYTYVQLFWWFAFSVPIFTLLRRILLWLGTGEFINKPSKFALYMSNFVSNNITPGMM